MQDSNEKEISFFKQRMDGKEKIAQEQKLEEQKNSSASDLQRGTDILSSDAEKIEIAIEVVTDIKSMLKSIFQNDASRIENTIVYFQKENKEEGKKKNKKKNVVYLGYNQTRKETYESYARQIIEILVHSVPKGQREGEQKNDGILEEELSHYKGELCKEYMKQIYYNDSFNFKQGE